ncbi:centrosomal protein of 128 kDa-like isoform X2 [Syngnathoides biaculeatus]|uniref:centrosomal protein of 128 kDa-like isoform X2 n=1 Tax=Syngnathoides biaculeatus TaxID=300417 RepID=UPI002ADE7843|nr:centrosomal protein of 128 kDa-like isoform X2 [Syngnathoides biaculeatus]
MDTSSGSDSHGRFCEAHRRPARERGRASGRAGDGRTADISEKISTLCSTLQDTNRNLSKVDQMLGQYREQTMDQAEAMALLRDNLEESISQLQEQRLSRTNAHSSASASSLHSSDLECCPGSDGQHFLPTSPLKDYTGRPGRRRRSRSASVRFKNGSLLGEDIHTLHQSLRDLRCDQQRLAVDLDREIIRRNRADVDTRLAIESLSDHVTPSQRQDSRHKVNFSEREDTMTSRLLNAEKEKSKMEQELEKVQNLLDRSEDSRVSLVQQVENMRGELQRTRKEKTELQRVRLQHGRGNYTGREEGRSQDGSDMENEVAELRAQLRKALANSEVEELKKALDRKEKERIQLSIQLEGLSADLARREQQQMLMLEQLRDIQTRGQTERTETETLLQESTRSRDELKAKAQKAVRQWRAKCNRLQKELEEARAHVQLHTDKAAQIAKEKEGSHSQLKALRQQAEDARRELTENLQRLAQREEELHRKDVALSESCQRQLAQEQEIREVKESSAALQMEVRRQSDKLARLTEENQRLIEQVETQACLSQRDQNKQTELQVTVNQMTSAHTQLAHRLTEAEASKKELQKVAAELRAKLALVQEEPDTLRHQLQLERDVHQKELENLRATTEEGRTKSKELHNMLLFCHQERDEIQSQLNNVKAGAVSDKMLCEALRIKLDRMKDECDKLAAQLSSKEDSHALLFKKYQLLQLELDEVRSDERGHVQLEEKVAQMEVEHGTLLSSISDELDAALQGLPDNGDDRFQATRKAGLVRDPSLWLAEIKAKLRLLREEVREHDTREQRLRRQHKHTRDELNALRQTRSTDQDALLQRLDEQEKLLLSISTEKKELLEGNRKKDEEMRNLQDRVSDLEMKSRAAMDYLKSIPDQLYLIDNFKDLEESQRQKEVVEQCYSKHKEIVWDLQHQLDESQRKIHEYRDEKLDATSRSMRLAVLASSVKSPHTFLGSSVRSNTLSPHKHLTTSDLDDSAVNAAKFLTDSSHLNHNLSSRCFDNHLTP